MLVKILITALLAGAAGAAGGMYAVTVSVDGHCSQEQATAQTDNGLDKFFAPPDAPLSGYKRYK